MLLRSTFAGLLAVAQVPESSPPAENGAITWRTPTSCPDRSALLQGIETRLGRPLRAGELAIDGVITSHTSPPPYRLRLRLRAGGPEESRTLTATTCAALADATAVLAATAIRASGVVPAAPERAPAPTGPTSAARPSRRESPGAGPTGGTEAGGAPPTGAGDAPPAEDAPPSGDASPIEEEGVSVAEVPVVETPEGASAEEPVPADVSVSAPWTAEPQELEPVVAEPPTPGPRRAIGGFVRIQGGPELGALPRISGAVGLAVGLLWRRARLELHGIYVAPRTAETPHGDLRASLAAASALGCARLGRGRVEVPLCGGLELGGMRGAARDVRDARTTTVPWLAVVASAGVAVRLGERVSLWGALQLFANLVRPGFELRDPGPVVPLFAPAPASGRLVFGVELRLRDPR